MPEEIIRMSKKELKKLKVVQKVIDKRIKQREAAEILALSSRHIRRIVKKVLEHGDTALIHGNRNRESNRKYTDEFRENVVKTIKDKYRDFGPTLASEKLEEIDKFKISRETLRNWMIQEAIWIPRKIRGKDDNHTWRKRKEYCGEMVQTDGSIGDWFERRGPRAVMMAYIDDATGKPFAKFYPAEDTKAAMDSFKKYIEQHGIPQSLYFDRNSIYKTTRQPDRDEELKNTMPKTQFEKVLDILEVEPIFAFSPQAKGRIERLFKTFKDRLIKEMRLAGVSNIKEANDFLKTYLPKYSERFSVAPADQKNLHRKIPKNMDLNWVFAFREERVVSKDFTIRWRNRFFLIKKQSIAIKKRRVSVLEDLSGELRIWFNGRFLDFKEITNHTLNGIRAKRKESDIIIPVGPKQPWKPHKQHPWRQQNRALFRELSR